MKKVVIIGGTGATGKELVTQLLVHSEVEEVIVFVRKPFPIEHPKLKVHIIDFEKMKEWKTLIQGDFAFSCLGTTLKDAGSKLSQWRVDYDYQLEFARYAKENDIGVFGLLSSTNASENSSFFYPKMKGKLEEAVKQLNFKQLLLFQPGLLNREGSERKSEVTIVKALSFFNKLGLLKKYSSISTSYLAKQMIRKSFNNTEAVRYISAVELLDKE